MYNLSRDILKPSYITKMHALLFQLNVFGLLGRQGILNKSYKEGYWLKKSRKMLFEWRDIVLTYESERKIVLR